MPAAYSQYGRNDVEMEFVNQYNDAWVRRKSSLNRVTRSPSQSLHARYFSMIHASSPVGESGRRRVRGFAAAVFVTILLTNYNLRKVAAFLHDAELEKSEPTKRPPAGPRQPRRRDREFYNPYTKTTPPGLLPPAHAEKKVAAKIAEQTKREKNTDGALPART
jgi:hypothetical protein